MGRSFGTLVWREWLASWKGGDGYRLRTAYAGLLLLSGVVFIVALGVRSGARYYDLAGAIRGFYYHFALGQFLLVTLIATMVFTRTLLREKEGGTLDLLILSPLPRFQLLLGKVAGEYLAALAVLASGLPILFCFLVFGGVTVGEVLSTHLILAGQLAIVAAVSLLLTVFLSSYLWVMLLTWGLVFGFLVAPAVGSALLPYSPLVWSFLAELNLFYLLEQEVSTVSVRPGPSLLIAAVGLAILIAACGWGSLFLDRQNALRKERRPRRRLGGTVGRGVRWLGSRRFLRLAFPDLLLRKMTHLGQEQSRVSHPLFRGFWIIFVAAYLTIAGWAWFMESRESQEFQIGLLVLVGGAILLLIFIRTALSTYQERKNGTFELLLSANVEPAEIVKRRIVGHLLWAAYMLLPLVLHFILFAFLHPRGLKVPVPWVLVGTVLLTLAGLSLGVTAGIFVAISTALRARSIVSALTSSLARSVSFSLLVCILALASLFTLVLTVPLLMIFLQGLYARIVASFRRGAVIG